MRPEPPLEEFAEITARPDSRIDLARAALAIARIEYPGLDVSAYVDRLDALARGAGGSGAGGDAVARLHRLREYLFAEQGFAGNRKDYYDPRNSFLNDVLDRRLGIPITLSLVLIEVGRRVGIEIDGIGLLGHFVAGARLGDSQILLDPFNGGALLTAETCEEVVGRALGRAVALTPEHFVPIGRRQLLARVLANLKAVYWRREAWDKVVRVLDRLLVLDPKAASEWRDRGVAWAKQGEVGRGLADWERYLTEFPNAADHEAIKGHLRKARQKLAQLN